MIAVPIIFGVIFWGYARYQEDTFNVKTMAYAVAQALAHSCVIWTFAGIALWLATFSPWHIPWLIWILLLAAVIIPIGARIAGFIFGCYLKLTCKYADRNHNDAFSAMKIDGYKNFLRLRISGDTVTVFPIGLDTVPLRKDWRLNQSRGPNAPSIFEPSNGMDSHLIEPPIVITGDEGLSPADVETKHEVVSKQ